MQSVVVLALVLLIYLHVQQFVQSQELSVNVVMFTTYINQVNLQSKTSHHIHHSHAMHSVHSSYLWLIH